jgi:hypothetical protein
VSIAADRDFIPDRRLVVYPGDRGGRDRHRSALKREHCHIRLSEPLLYSKWANGTPPVAGFKRIDKLDDTVHRGDSFLPHFEVKIVDDVSTRQDPARLSEESGTHNLE